MPGKMLGLKMPGKTLGLKMLEFLEILWADGPVKAQRQRDFQQFHLPLIYLKKLMKVKVEMLKVPQKEVARIPTFE
jgi:hypothetical protein